MTRRYYTDSRQIYKEYVCYMTIYNIDHPSSFLFSIIIIFTPHHYHHHHHNHNNKNHLHYHHHHPNHNDKNHLHHHVPSHHTHSSPYSLPYRRWEIIGIYNDDMFQRTYDISCNERNGTIIEWKVNGVFIVRAVNGTA